MIVASPHHSRTRADNFYQCTAPPCPHTPIGYYSICLFQTVLFFFLRSPHEIHSSSFVLYAPIGVAALRRAPRAASNICKQLDSKCGEIHVRWKRASVTSLPRSDNSATACSSRRRAEAAYMTR